MEIAVMTVFAAEMKKLNLNYALMEWKKDIVYPYFTGEYYENGYSYEDSATSGEILLEGWTRGRWTELYELCEQIKEHFVNFTTVKGNTGISITYLNAAPVRTGDIELKKIQIRLATKSWKGL